MLIQKAKAEWTKRNMPKESKTEGGGSKCLFLFFLLSFAFLRRGKGRERVDKAGGDGVRVVREL